MNRHTAVSAEHTAVVQQQGVLLDARLLVVEQVERRRALRCHLRHRAHFCQFLGLRYQLLRLRTTQQGLYPPLGPGKGQDICDPGIGEVHIACGLKQNRRAVGPVRHQLGTTGQRHTGHRPPQQFHHGHAGGGIGGLEGQAQQVHEFRVVFLRQLVQPPDVVSHLSGVNERQGGTNIRVPAVKPPFRRIGRCQFLHPGAEVRLGPGVQRQFVVVHKVGSSRAAFR